MGGRMEYMGRSRDWLPDFLLRATCHTQAKAHVVGYRHMRVESIRLKNHGDPSFGRIDLIHELAADIDFALVHLFKTAKNSNRSGFSTPSRANKATNLPFAHIKLTAVITLVLTLTLKNFREVETAIEM